MSLNIKVVLLTNVAMYEKLIDTVYHIVKKKIIYGSIPECVSKAGSLKSRTLDYSWNCFHPYLIKFARCNFLCCILVIVVQ